MLEETNSVDTVGGIESGGLRVQLITCSRAVHVGRNVRAEQHAAYIGPVGGEEVENIYDGRAVGHHGLVVPAADEGSYGHVGGMGLGVLDSSVGVHIDLLAAWNFNLLALGLVGSLLSPSWLSLRKCGKKHVGKKKKKKKKEHVPPLHSFQR